MGKKILSFGWLSVGIALLVLSLGDVHTVDGARGWVSVGIAIAASALAIASAVAMRFAFKAGNAVSLLTSLCFALYWIYLFLIAPPIEVNGFLLTGTAIICLAIATAVSILVPAHSKP